MTKPLRIEKMFVWIATEQDGSQGVPAMLHDGTWTPLVGADRERVESLRPHAMLCLTTCRRVELVEFTGRQVLETHGAPGGTKH